MSINRVVVSGNLTRDPDIRATASGMNILTFGMAVNDRRRNPQTQEWEDYANFVDCVMFGNRTDYMHRMLHKGIRVVVEGKLRYSSWERDGQRRSKLEVVVDDIDFVSPRQSQNQGGYVPQQTGGYQSQQQQSYSQGPSYNSPAPMQTSPTAGEQQMPQANQGQQMPSSTQGYGAPRPQANPMQQTDAVPVQPAPRTMAHPQQATSTPAPVSSPSAHPVTAPPETDLYDEEIPF